MLTSLLLLLWLLLLDGREFGSHRRVPRQDHRPGGRTERGPIGNISRQNGTDQREIIQRHQTLRTPNQN